MAKKKGHLDENSTVKQDEKQDLSSKMRVFISSDSVKEALKKVNNSQDSSEAEPSEFGVITTDSVRDSGVKPFDTNKNLEKIRRLEDKSHENYHEVVTNIIDISKEHLTHADKDKTSIRKTFIIIFSVMLFIQLAAIITFMALKAVESVAFDISDSLMTVFIGSVFVETLGVIGVMIGFAFASKDEVKIVKLLTAVINSYQKYFHEQ